MPEDPSPRRLGMAAIVVVSAVILMVVAIFVGLNLQHAKTQRESRPGKSTRRTPPKPRRILDRLRCRAGSWGLGKRGACQPQAGTVFDHPRSVASDGDSHGLQAGFRVSGMRFASGDAPQTAHRYRHRPLRNLSRRNRHMDGLQGSYFWHAQSCGSIFVSGSHHRGRARLTGSPVHPAAAGRRRPLRRRFLVRTPALKCPTCRAA